MPSESPPTSRPELVLSTNYGRQVCVIQTPRCPISMQVGASFTASRHRISHVKHPHVLARARQRPATTLDGYSAQFSAAYGYWKGKTRQLSTSSSVEFESVLPQIQGFTTRYPISVFRSVSNNPYHNLAIENYLLKKSEPNSRILFTYTNRPCVVFGRNQNPWLECNLAKVQEGLPFRAADWATAGTSTQPDNNPDAVDGTPVSLDLVRRRSGGGTVIHDVGNLNFSFIVPNDKDFTRDKHAWLVVSVLQDFGIRLKGQAGSANTLFEDVRVNERHDIVMTRRLDKMNLEDAHEYKASGSAFKLTRGRALHHGTLLHSSPNVQEIKEGDGHASTFSTMLSSPAKTYLQAKGVGSVRSPVHNLFHVNSADQRWRLTSDLEAAFSSTFRSTYFDNNAPCIVVGSEDCRPEANKEIFDDVQEMMTDEWRFCQTPSFEYASEHGHGNMKLQFEVKHGLIKSPRLETTDKSLAGTSVFAELEGKKLHEVQSWGRFVPESLRTSSVEITNHLATVFHRISLANMEGTLPTSGKIIDEKHVTKTAPGHTAVKRKSREGNIEIEASGENTVAQR